MLKHGVIVNLDIVNVSVLGYVSQYVQNAYTRNWLFVLNGAPNLVNTLHGDDLTIFMFDQGEWKTPAGSRYPLLANAPTSDCVFVNGKPFINLGFYAPIATDTQVMMAHELMHAFDKIATALGYNVIDQMDTYDQNNNPDSPTGNFAIQWKNLQPWLNATNHMKPTIQQSTLSFIESCEGFKPTPYLDVAGHYTIGYGFRVYAGIPVNVHTIPVTQEQAQNELSIQVKKYADAVLSFVTYPINQNQFDALVSICYNEGINAIMNSTLVRDLNAGLLTAAADQFLAWKYAGGMVSQGLLNRRSKERALFLS